MRRIEVQINKTYVVIIFQLMIILISLTISIHSEWMLILIPVFFLLCFVTFRISVSSLWIVCFTEPSQIQNRLLKLTDFKGSNTFIEMAHHLNELVPSLSCYIWLRRLQSKIDMDDDGEYINKEALECADCMDVAWYIAPETSRKYFDKWVQKSNVSLDK